MMLIILLIAPLVAALSYVFARNETMIRWMSYVWSTIVAGLSIAVTYPVLFQAATTANGWWRVDAFAAVLIVLVGLVQWTATLVSGPYLREELHEKVIDFSHVRLYHALLQLFVLSMLLVLSADNIGIMWIALEATTLSTTLLVAFYTYEGSLEAAWKYIVLCSVGIGLGLLGVLLVFYAANTSGAGISANLLSWTSLRAISGSLSPTIVRWAFVFIFIGYGAKVGLVPMHTWLPDAHGRTPSPISGMLSGVLLNVALFGILRFKGITDAALGSSSWTNELFLVFGAMSFVLPAAFILVQRNYKRLLAYSSIEHMGFIVFCIGLGKVGMLAALIHIIGHSLIKSTLFFGTGNILLRWKTTKISSVGPVMTSLPYTGTLFVIGVLALLATPPSPLFASELLAFSAAIVAHPILTLGMLLAGTVIFAGMIHNLAPMVFAKKEDPVTAPVERWNVSHTAMAFQLTLMVALGVALLVPQTQAFLTNLAGSII